MDNKSLSELLIDPSARQFWVKPIGDPTLPSDGEPHLLSIDTSSMRIDFVSMPSAVRVGDILIVYRIKLSQLVYVAEVVSSPVSATADEMKREPLRKRWRWSVQTRNLSPTFGTQWSKYPLKPFALAKEYNERNPLDKVKLGTLNFGKDKVRISPGFGSFLINEIARL